MTCRVAILLAVLLMGGTAHAQEENVTMKDEWFETRPVCFGRYVADVPKILQPNVSKGRLEEFTITNLGPASQAELEKKIADRKALMEAGAEIDDAPKTNYLSESQDEGITTLVYERARVIEYFPPVTYDNIETYFRSDDHLFEIKGRIKKDDRETRLASLFRIAHATRPRDMDEVPEEKGYCLQDAFVALPDKLDSYVGAYLRNESVESRFTFNIVVINSETINEKKYNWPSEARQRVVAGLQGVEAWGTENKPYPGSRVYAGEFYGFRPSGNGAQGQSINIRTTRHYSAPDSPPFSMEVATRFWDLVLNSMRLR